MQSVAVLGYLETFSAVVLSAVLLREGMSLLRLLGVGCILRRRYACGDEWEKDKVLLFRNKRSGETLPRFTASFCTSPVFDLSYKFFRHFYKFISAQFAVNLQ